MNSSNIQGKKRRSSLAALALAAGLLSASMSVTAFADTNEVGPGVGLETADGLNPDYTGSQNGAFTKVNGQYVNGEGTAIEGALFRGVSVSKYQQDIDWQAVASDDINFAFIRMGYVDDLDPYFDVNMREAAAHDKRMNVFLNHTHLSSKIIKT